MGRTKSVNNHNLTLEQKFCRTCLSSGTNMNSIDEKLKDIEELTGLGVSDRRHNSLDWLCIDCETILDKFQSFRNVCYIVNDILKKCFRTSRVSRRKLNFELIKKERDRMYDNLKLSLSNCNQELNDELKFSEIKNVFTVSDVNAPKAAETLDKDPELNIKNELSETCSISDSIPDSECFEENDDTCRKTNEIYNKSDHACYNDEMDNVVLSKIKKEMEYTNRGMTESNEIFYDIGADRKKTKYNKKREKNKKKIKKKKNHLLSDGDEIQIEKDVKGIKLRRKKVSIVIDSVKASEVILTTEEQLKEREDRSKEESYIKSLFKCEMCILAFRHEYTLKNHMLKHSEERGPHSCYLCSQRFGSYRQLRTHESLHALRLVCYACQRRLRDRTRLAEHLAWHAGQTYHCSECSAVFVRRTTLHNHMRLKHKQNKFKCDYCAQAFNVKERLKEHQMRHFHTRSHYCDVCGKSFYTAGNLSNHQMTHTSSRDYYCVECDLHFKSSTIFKNHLTRSSKHRDPSLLRFPCEHCNKRFETELMLSRHVDAAHFVKKRLQCDKCSAKYVTRQGLNFHRRSSHEGFVLPRSHKCNTCSKSFSSKALLINHMRTHTGERPFECSQCKKKFTQKSAMRTHINLVHLKIKRVRKQSNDALKTRTNTVDNNTDAKIICDADPEAKVSLDTEWCHDENVESRKISSKEQDSIASRNLIDESRSVFFGARQEEEHFDSKQFIVDQ